MQRRTFLKLAGLLALPLPARAFDGPPVVIVGAGPAGLAAAFSLLEAGIPVKVLEANTQVGGKVKGWREALDGVDVDVEHGVHGWWDEYRSFDDLLRRAGIQGVFNAAEKGGTFRWPGGEIDATSLSGGKDFLKRFYADAKAAGSEHPRVDYQMGRRFLRKSEVEPTRAALGGRPASAWLAEAPLTLWKTYAQTVAWSMYFLPPERVDAAEWVLGEAFYGTGHADNAKVRWLRGNPQTLIWEPLRQRIEAMGGEILLGQRVSELVVERGRVIGVRVGEPLDGAWVAEVGEDFEEIPRGEGLPSIFVGRVEGEVVAYNGRCTHAGCPLQLAPDGFACPCHGGKFDFRGQPVAGPPEKPLEPLFVDEGEGYHIEGEAPSPVIAGRSVILAVEAPVAVALAGRLLPRLRGLTTTRHAVARFWLDTDVPPERGHSAMLQEFRHSSNAFLLHRLQDEARAWAAARGGAVIELQAHKELPDGPPEAILDVLEAELRLIWPELAAAKVLKRALADGKEFTAFEPGWHEHAPQVDGDFPGLLFAGDYVLFSENCAFMERAVRTGFAAAAAARRS